MVAIMKKIMIALLACAFSISLLSSFAKDVQVNKKAPGSIIILAKVQGIRNESDKEGRIAAAKDLADHISTMPGDKKRGLSNSEIDSIAALLFDCDDGVRMYAAIALGNVGSRAVRVLPQLRKSLDDNNLRMTGQIGPALGSTSAIYKAIEKISSNSHRL
jgi:hypothetical protein